MEKLYKGAGNIKDYEQSLRFLDCVFFTDEPETHFLSMIPKLYKKEYNHCEKNMIVADENGWRAAVGLYIENMDICGEKIVCGGIGNVAVGKEYRSMGYMKDCMRLAKEKCLKENADFMILGGQRQRYGYFGFEPAGRGYEYSFNEINARHVYGKDYVSPLEACAVTENDSASLDFIFDLYNRSFSSRIIRKREMLYDILVTWHQRPFVFKENGTPVAYALFSEDFSAVVEVAALNDEYFTLLIPALLKNSGKESINIKLPPYADNYNQILTDICEFSHVNHCELINILNWKHMITALLNQKAKFRTLRDGEVSLLIHGDKKDEIFTIKIENNSVKVTDGGENSIEISQKQAMQLFFGNYSQIRNQLSSCISGWFPLHFYLFSTDMV